MFINLTASGINAATVAWYEFLPAAPDKHARLKLVTINGALIEIDGDEGQALYEELQATGTDILPTFLNKQQNISDLRDFIFDNTSLRPLLRVSLTEALNSLGA